MSLFEETIRKKFGFPSKRESLDQKINNYRIGEAIALDEAMALRQTSISYLEEQIRQLERVINDNQIFIDAYESIKNEATEKVKMPSSLLKIKIKDLDGKIIVYDNFVTIEGYLETVKKSGNASLIASYIEQMCIALEKMWQAYAFTVIQKQGVFDNSNSDFAEGLNVYQEYTKAINYMQAGYLKDENRESIKLPNTNITFIINARNLCLTANNVLNLALEHLKIALEQVKQTQASDEYAKKVITEMQTMLKSTSAYFQAKRDEDILNRIAQFR